MTAEQSSIPVSNPQTIQLRKFHISLDKIHSVTEQETIARCEELMDEHNIDQVPVVSSDDSGMLRGAITRRDVAAVNRPERPQTRAGDIVTGWTNDPSASWPENTPLDDGIIEALFENDFMITTKGEQKIAGIVTAHDAMQYLWGLWQKNDDGQADR